MPSDILYWLFLDVGITFIINMFRQRHLWLFIVRVNKGKFRYTFHETKKMFPNLAHITILVLKCGNSFGWMFTHPMQPNREKHEVLISINPYGKLHT